MTRGPTELSWVEDERLAALRFVSTGVGGVVEAEALTAQLDAWTGGASAPYRLLVDCSSMVDLDAGWRTTWAEYLCEHRDAIRIAWFNANARVRLIILMFRTGTGIEGEAFETEEQARAWLQVPEDVP